jgi:hypothetical protein
VDVASFFLPSFCLPVVKSFTDVKDTVRSKSVANPWRDERIAVLALMEKNQLSTLM